MTRWIEFQKPLHPTAEVPDYRDSTGEKRAGIASTYRFQDFLSLGPAPTLFARPETRTRDRPIRDVGRAPRTGVLVVTPGAIDRGRLHSAYDRRACVSTLRGHGLQHLAVGNETQVKSRPLPGGSQRGGGSRRAATMVGSVLVSRKRPCGLDVRVIPITSNYCFSKYFRIHKGQHF